MASIVGLAFLAVVVILPLWTARAVLEVVLAWLVRHGDRTGAIPALVSMPGGVNAAITASTDLEPFTAAPSISS